MKKLVLILILIHPLLIYGQESPLNLYVTEGLKNNLALQQQQFSLEKSLEALKEARSLFFPTVSIEARYSRAGGGRVIDFPVGDLINPVYRSLNDLFRIHSITTGFPTDIPNERIPFLRKEEQETKIRLIQPLFQPAIFYNYKIKSSLNKATQAQVAAFKRSLIADIKTAYFNYQKALKVVELLRETRALLDENLRVSENLVKNGKATEDVIFRARAEIADLEQKNAEAQKNKILASQYFNFLLNKDLNSSIRTLESSSSSLEENMDIEKILEHALRHRDEFQQLQNAITATSHQVKLANSSLLPTVTAVVDYGIQGEKYSFRQDDDYWMASLIFQWKLFDGFQSRAKKAQAMMDKKKFEIQMIELENQIRLQVQEEYQAMIAARLTVTAAQEKKQSTQRSLEIISKKYAYGTAPHIEFLDARTTFTNAAISLIITRYDYFLQQAKLERAAALSDLEKYQ